MLRLNNKINAYIIYEWHQRRLQYMEAEQIKEWSLKHPGERIIDVDLPLSYGVYDPHKDTKNINCLSFKWDPTRG